MEVARPQLDDDPILGRQISHFRVLRLLGRGGMGVVYQAVDLELEREVALKFLSSARSATARDEVRFRREAQATAALDHPNIGTVYEIGEHEGRRFIAMAFYDGETLAARLASRTRAPVAGRRSRGHRAASSPRPWPPPTPPASSIATSSPTT